MICAAGIRGELTSGKRLDAQVRDPYIGNAAVSCSALVGGRLGAALWLAGLWGRWRPCRQLVALEFGSSWPARLCDCVAYAIVLDGTAC